MDVGFVGLGRMRVAMAASLLKAGHAVTVYSRTPQKAEALVRDGAKRAGTIAEACQGDAVFAMLANDGTVGAVVFGPHGIIERLRRDTIHISCSTISVNLVERVSAAHATGEQRVAAAPVLGRPEAAAVSGLLVVAAGESTNLRVVSLLLNAIGQRTLIVAETSKAVNLVKLSGNFLIASVIEALGEAMAFVSKGGVAPRPISKS